MAVDYLLQWLAMNEPTTAKQEEAEIIPAVAVDGTNAHQNINCNRGDNDSIISNNSIHNNAIIGDDDPRRKATYLNLLITNREFRLYLLGYLCALLGEWLTYIASISLIEQILSDDSDNSNNGSDHDHHPSRTYVSILVVVRLLPSVVLSPFAGALADSRDKRQSMMALDVIGIVIPWLYLVALQRRSLGVIYGVTLLKYSLGALYEPSMMSIIPLLVEDEHYLQKAVTLVEGLWSVMAGVGSAIGGLVVAYYGFKICFVLDSLTYLLSASFLWRIGGTWNASSPDSAANQAHENSWEALRAMTVEGVSYLRSSPCGAFVFLKTSGAVIYGACDVLNVSFSEADYSRFNTPEMTSGEKLGMLFASTGTGCILGPVIADRITRMDIPASLQKACICGMAIASFGCIGMSFVLPFPFVCLFTAVRSAGDSINWVDSSLLIQKFAPTAMLGRVTAVEIAMAYLSEALAACFCGILMDQLELSAHESSFVLGSIGTFVFGFWLTFHLLRLGANCPEEKRAAASQRIPAVIAIATEKTSLLSEDSERGICR